MMEIERQSRADLKGPWIHPGVEAGLVERCRRGWKTPIGELTNRQFATHLVQKIGIAHLLLIARERIKEAVQYVEGGA